jgi:serine/threonine protein kinase
MKTPDYFSEDFKNLVTGLIQLDPATRLQMSEVLSHPWVLNPDCATLEEIKLDFANRKAIIDAKNEAKRKQKKEMIERIHMQHVTTGATRKQYRTVSTTDRAANE